MTQVEDLGLEYAIRMRQEARDSRDTVPLSNLLRLPREVGLGNPLWSGRQKVEGNGILLVAPVAHQSTVTFTMEQNDPASDLCRHGRGHTSPGPRDTDLRQRKPDATGSW